MKKLFIKNILSFVVMLAVLLASSAGSQVAEAGQSGRGNYQGYFTGATSYYGDFVLPIIRNGQAIPASTINDIGNFLGLLKSYNASGNRQKVTGSAFIVYTMLGRPGANYSRIVSNADWADLETRLASARIDWNSNVIGNINSFYQTGIDDDAYYSGYKNETGITFYNSDGSIAYQILRRCANPIGDLGGLKLSDWNLSASSSVNRTTANPGDTVQWSHTLTNNGPGATTQPVSSDLALSGFTNGWGNPVAGASTPAGAGPGTIRTFYDYTLYTIRPDDAGNTLCQTVRYSPANSRGAPGGQGNTPCVTVPYNYSLTPSVSLNGQVTIESGGSLRVTTAVDNRGPTRSRNTDWRLTRMIFKPGTTLSAADVSARDSGSDSCGSFTSAGRTACDTVWQDGARVFSIGTSSAPVYDYISPTDIPTGSQVCFTGSVSPPTQADSPVWRHSTLLCVIISKQPKVQIHGGDVRSGGRVETSLSTITAGGATKTYGSWVEYGALSVGPNAGLASGSGLNNGGSTSPMDWNRLTFANVDNNGTPMYGNFAPNHAAISPYFATYTGQFAAASSQTVPASVTLNGLASGTYMAGNVIIDASSVGQDSGNKGKSIIITSGGTVTINGDIAYTGPGAGNSFTSTDQIPQVVIVARAINITGGVRNIDAWLMTTGDTGYVNTCSDVAVGAPLDTATCANTLTINGPVATAHLYLRRTAGAEDGNRSGNPAEVFNLRADAYLWAQARASQSGKAETVYTSELPPRF